MKLRKILPCIVFLFVFFFSFCEKVTAKEVNVYMFYGKTCPHCEEAYEYLNGIKDEYDLNIIRYEVWNDSENKEIMNDIASYLDVNPTGVPFTIIDNTPIFGYSKGVTDDTFLYHIRLASKENFVDNVGIKLGIVKGVLSEDKNNNDGSSANLYSLSLPFSFNVDLKNVNLYFSTIILGLLNGFNTCTLWMLLFLVCLLANIKDKKKMLWLCLIFVFSLSIAYLFTILSSVNYLSIVNYFPLVRIIFSVTAITFAAIKLNSFVEEPSRSDKKVENKLISSIKNNDKFLFTLSVLGIVILGILSVVINVYHDSSILTLFNNLLSLNTISGIRRAMYLIVYVIFFMLANVIILSILFFIYKKISNKLNKYINLIRGLLLFIIGILLLLKPEWLMFGF